MDKWSLPGSWEWSSLEDVVDVGSHNIEPSDDPKKTFNYIALENIEKSTGRLVEFVPQKGRQIRSTKTVFNAGDVLYGKLRPYLQKTIIAPFDGICVTDIVPLKPYGDGRFVFHYLLGPDHLAYISPLMAGIRMPRLRTGDLVGMPIPCAPLNEQRRIADKIDALQAKSRRAREAFEAVGPLLEKFRQSVLAAAFRGDLTAEWREQHPDVEPAEKLLERIRTERRARWEEAELAKMRAKGIKPKDNKWKAKYTEPEPIDATALPELPEGWCWAKVEELACDVRYGTSAKTSDDETQMPVLRMGNIVDGALVYDDLKYLDRSHDDLTELRLQHGDILFNRTNSAELVGKTAMFDRDEDFSFASYLIRVRVLLIAPEVLVWYINSPFGRQWVSQNVSQQVGQANINGSKLKALAVPIPPHEEQVELAKKVKQALAVIKGQRENSIGLMGQAAKLDQSILAKAFRGELVPQDPNDEPASVLLERIKAERETETGKKRTRKKAE